MKLFNSIRWRLQLWYGLILFLVLAGFGFTSYQLERGRQFRRVDEELHRRFALIAGANRPLFRVQRDRRPMSGMEESPDEGAPEQDRRPPGEFRLPPESAGMFGGSDPHNYYFIVRNDERDVARSTNAPTWDSPVWKGAFAFPLDRNRPPEGPRGRPPETIAVGQDRVIAQATRAGLVEVGCSIVPELKELRIFAFTLFGVGAGILLLGLAGGWWLASRAIKPIDAISATAGKISAGDLSQRINSAETESELGKLATVLNSTFARLESSFAQQQQFASDAAHELRTPVSVILTQTQTALNRERSAADYRDTIEACQRSAQRMRRLIESLLELTRLDAGQEQLKRMQFDLAATIGDCVELITPLADERGIKIVPGLQSVDCLGDSERIGQVVTNLLTNAIQYNRIGGEVRVQLQKQNNLAILTIADTGSGISAEDLPRVFERFYRADKARTGGNGHTGLGLAICKAIVEAHGGTIEVRSEPGKGTDFVVTIPA